MVGWNTMATGVAMTRVRLPGCGDCQGLSGTDAKIGCRFGRHAAGSRIGGVEEHVDTRVGTSCQGLAPERAISAFLSAGTTKFSMFHQTPLPPEDPRQLRNVSMGQRHATHTPTYDGGVKLLQTAQNAGSFPGSTGFCAARCTTIVRTRATPCKNLRPMEEMMRYVPRSKSVDSRKRRVLGEVPPVKSEATGSGRGWLKDVTRFRCFVELNSVE